MGHAGYSEIKKKKYGGTNNFGPKVQLTYKIGLVIKNKNLILIISIYQERIAENFRDRADHKKRNNNLEKLNTNYK
jgi:hypothetical protein